MRGNYSKSDLADLYVALRVWDSRNKPKGVSGMYNQVVGYSGSLGSVCEVKQNGSFDGISDLEGDEIDSYLLGS